MNQRTSIWSVTLLVVVLIMVAALPITGFGEVPQLVNYQGKLTDDEGAPLSGTFPITFRFYDAAETDPAANLLWVETQSSVSVQNGIFNVHLGSVTSWDTAVQSSTGEYWLEVEVEGPGGPEVLAPRQLVTSVIFAFASGSTDHAAFADDADKVDGFEGAVLDQSAHLLDTANPHAVSAAQAGAATAADIATHTGIADAHHTKTTSFADLTDQASDLQIPIGIARDSEISWSNLLNIPAGFADGIDNGATYTPGTGININGTTLNVNVPLILSQSSSSGIIQGTNTGSGSGVWAKNIGSGNEAFLGNALFGVYGVTTNGTGYGVAGYNNTSDLTKAGVQGWNGGTGPGVRGENDGSGNYGYLGSSTYGAYGRHASTQNIGYLGSSSSGVTGSSSNQTGVYGFSGSGRAGHFVGTGTAVSGSALYAQNLSPTGIAGFFQTASIDATMVLFQQGGGDILRGFQNTIDGEGFKVQIRSDGYTRVSVLELTGGSDLSEQFDIAKAETGLDPSPGMVVSIDPDNPGQLMVTDRAYDRRVAGIISGAGGVKPGMLMGQKGSVANGANPVALSGRVYCWTDASFGSIAPGDMLTTSKTPGHAMKVGDHEKAYGSVIGKAMTSLNEGKGLVLVLVNLQ